MKYAPGMSESRGLPRRVARWAVKRYYADIEIIDGERIPQGGAVLLCANHANSLVDSVVVGITAQRPVRFMAKATLFDVPVFGTIMRALGMVPAFRGIDDQAQVRRNLESLQTGAGVLIEGHAMGIFPEGMSTDEMHLVKVRTGAARMALQAVEEGTPDVRIAPIGIAYEHKERFRSSVLVRVAEPIVAAEFLDAEDGNVPRARRAITAELDARLKGVAIHLENPEWEPWLADLETLVPAPSGSSGSPGSSGSSGSPGSSGSSKSSTAALWQRKRIADAINYFWENDQPRAEALAAQITAYRDDVHAVGLRLDSEVLRLSGFGVLFKLLGRLLWLAVLLIPALLGTIHFIVPFVLVRALDRWLGEPGKMTVATHKLMYGIPVYVLWHLGVIAALWFFVDARIALVWLLVAPFAGALALDYARKARRLLRLLYHETRVALRREPLHSLREQRAAIRERLGEMAAEFAEVSPGL